MFKFFTTSIIVFVCLTVLIIMPACAEDDLLDQADFELNTASDLAEVCNAPPDDPLVEKAVYFCLGFVTGLAHYHTAISQAEDIDPITCPQKDPSRVELALTFLKWYEKNPQYKEIAPEDAVLRAAAERWPCK
jgi:Rap1a immunity proteins